MTHSRGGGGLGEQTRWREEATDGKNKSKQQTLLGLPRLINHHSSADQNMLKTHGGRNLVRSFESFPHRSLVYLRRGASMSKKAAKISDIYKKNPPKTISGSVIIPNGDKRRHLCPGAAHRGPWRRPPGVSQTFSGGGLNFLPPPVSSYLLLSSG